MEEITLVQDIAIIMAVAGGITLIFRKLHQPPILGYLIAGILIGPYTFSSPPVTDRHTINLLADLGLILLLFGLGLEFSWSKIRQIGLSVLLIGCVEILTMVSIGYGVGRIMGWEGMDPLFLGAALHISSSAIIVKILRDLGKMDKISTKLIVGILIVEDFAAVIMLTILSGVATTGTASVADIGVLILKLVVFVAASLTLGTFIVPRLMRFTHQFHSNEALLITTIGLCFTMALIGESLGLSVAAGAFIMGSLIGDTEHSEEVVELVSPIRDMFAAIFFVAIGMLIDIKSIADFIVPGIVVTIVFIMGKIFSNSLAAFASGHNSTTSLEVGTSMSQMGEFSLAIAKLGIDKAGIVAPIYPVIATVTAFTSLTTPYFIRSSNTVSSFLNRRSPRMLKEYMIRLPDWLQAIRATYSRDTKVAVQVKLYIRTVIINLLIIMVIIGTGTYTLQFVHDISFLKDLGRELIGLFFGLALLILCVPSMVIIWRNVQLLVNEATMYVLRRRQSSKWLEREAVRIVLRDSIVIILSIFVLLWFIPFLADLLSIGSYALVVPIFVLSLVLYIVVRSIRQIHSQLEHNFSRILLGEHISKKSASFKADAENVAQQPNTDASTERGEDNKSISDN